MSGRSRFSTGSGHDVNNRRFVTEFNMAGSHDPANGQHVQRVAFLFLVRSPQLYVLDGGRENLHRVFFLY
jgi:hypothetical protein